MAQTSFCINNTNEFRLYENVFENSLQDEEHLFLFVITTYLQRSGHNMCGELVKVKWFMWKPKEEKIIKTPTSFHLMVNTYGNSLAGTTTFFINC